MRKKTYPGTVLDRLNRKLAVLKKLCAAKHVPAGTYVPGSLRDFARWHDPKKRIYPVGSPNEVTTTHPRYGHIASEAQDLLAKTQSGSKAHQRRPKLGERCANLQAELDRAREREQAVMGQFHMMQNQIDHLNVQLASANVRHEYLARQNSLLTKQLSELRSVAVIHVSPEGE